MVEEILLALHTPNIISPTFSLKHLVQTHVHTYHLPYPLQPLVVTLAHFFTPFFFIVSKLGLQTRDVCVLGCPFNEPIEVKSAIVLAIILEDFCYVSKIARPKHEMLQECGKLGTRTRRGIGINVIVAIQGNDETTFVGAEGLAFVLKEFWRVCTAGFGMEEVGGNCRLRHVWDRHMGEDRGKATIDVNVGIKCIEWNAGLRRDCFL